MDIDELLKNRDKLQQLLQKVSVNELADAIAGKKNVVALYQEGVRILMINQQGRVT